jgi:dephospho-CoA kinase
MLIGLTGSIGAGKSTVAARLKALGAYVIDVDEIAREVSSRGSEGLGEIVSTFGEGVLQADGMLDRKKLAAIVFAEEKKRLALNAILHPRILNAMRERAEEVLAAKKTAIVVYDMPLLIETGEYARVDSVWLVTASDETRIARVMARDACTRDEARRRIAAQMPQQEKRAYAHEIIDNSGDLNALYARVDALYETAKGKYGET